jgi:hypothetical protein
MSEPPNEEIRRTDEGSEGDFPFRTMGQNLQSALF